MNNLCFRQKLLISGLLIFVSMMLPEAFGKCGVPETTWNLSIQNVTLISGRATNEEIDQESSLWPQSGELTIDAYDKNITIVILYTRPFVVINYVN